MTQKDKIKEKFLKDPVSLSILKILNFLLEEGYKTVEAKGSHTKVIHVESGKHKSIPIHSGDTKSFYKKELKDFYLSNKK